MKVINYKDLQEIKRDGVFKDEFFDSVKAIVDNVKNNGDKALFDYAKKFDNTELNKSNLIANKFEIEDAYRQVEDNLLNSLRISIKNVYNYQKKNKMQMDLTMDKDKMLGYIVRPMERVAIYAPGGTAAYPSTVVMGVMTAKAAGVKEVVLATPYKNGEINPLTLVAAQECGVDKIYKVGGAQAISALAYGTESVEKVDFIAGPGNVFVTLAKKYVYGSVGIDMIAGPSEIAIVADDSAKPEFVASDMLAQAEHDALALSVLITPSNSLAEKVQVEIEKQLKELAREDIARKSIENNAYIVIVKDNMEGIECANKIAPEHLEICLENSDKYLNYITDAGAIFLGNYTPEAVGDYFAGPNHVLPTCGSARYFQTLNANSFLRKINVMSYSRHALVLEGKHIVNLAECEGLTGHANSVKVRISRGKKNAN